MIYNMILKVPLYELATISEKQRQDWARDVQYLIYSREVVHNDIYDVDFIVLGIQESNNILENVREYIIRINVLDSNNNGIDVYRLNNMTITPFELLPTKRVQNQVAGEI